MTYSMNTVHTQAQAVPVGTSLTMSAVRAQSRLNALFVTFRGADTYIDGAGVLRNVDAAYRHEVVAFLNPGDTDNNASDGMVATNR